jgi:5-(carboxyamino)imidazole ribonucleotide synthase
LEAYVPFICELSVVAARGIDGAFAHYGVIENIHARHILDLSVAPARIAASVQAEAVGAPTTPAISPSTPL